MSIGTNIKRRRFELNITQQELASMLGYRTRSTIAKIESGENSVSLAKLPAFAKALDTTVEALVGSSAPLTVPVSHSTTNTNIAVILAGGKSSRNQQNIPNQFINVLGKPVIIYCMEAYQRHPLVTDIYTVCLNGWEDILSSYANQFGITKLSGIIPAGNTGMLSVKNAVDFLQGKCSDDSIIFFQESTRPLISEDTISKLTYTCKEYGSAVTCQPMDDRIQFLKSESGTKYVNRHLLVEAQTPEAYRYSYLTQAFQLALERKSIFDESICYMFMNNLGYELHFCEGSRNSIKIIRQEDIAIFTALVKAGM